MPRDFGQLLEAALGMLRTDVPEAYARIAERLESAPILFDVDGREFLLCFDQGGHRLADPAGGRQVRVATDTGTILALLDDEISLLGSLRSGRLELAGSPGSVADFDDALNAFLAGAIRTTRAADLLKELRVTAREKGDETQ